MSTKNLRIGRILYAPTEIVLILVLFAAVRIRGDLYIHIRNKTIFSILRIFVSSNKLTLRALYRSRLIAMMLVTNQLEFRFVW